ALVSPLYCCRVLATVHYVPSISAYFVILLTYLLFFFNHTATTGSYTLSLHDALPIWPGWRRIQRLYRGRQAFFRARVRGHTRTGDRKSTRLNSSHVSISYAVFCLKKKIQRQRKR